MEREIRKLQRTIGEHLTDFLEWFVAQTIVSAFVNIYYNGLGFVVNAIFFIIGLWGFFSEGRQVVREYEGRKWERLLWVFFALVFDIYLSLTIH
jgi:hypothetical protein